MSQLREQISKSVHLDANQVGFFATQLENILAKTYDVLYPNLKAMTLIPVSTDTNPGAEFIAWYSYDQVGIAKIISNYAKDLPRADVRANKNSSNIRSIGSAYGYSIQEIRAAMLAGVPLEQRKANASRRTVDQKINQIAWFGDDESGLVGLLNNSNIPTADVENDGTGNTTQWVNKTPDLILRDMNALANGIVSLTNGVETPDTLIMPIDQYTLIATTPRSSVSDTTILEYFLQNSPFIKTVTWVNELKGAGTAGVDIMIAYERNPDKLTLEIPQMFEQFPPQEDNLEFKINCHARCGGVLTFYPLSISIGEGI